MTEPEKVNNCTYPIGLFFIKCPILIVIPNRVGASSLTFAFPHVMTFNPDYNSVK